MAQAVTGRFFPVSGQHLGQTGAIATFNETTLNNGGAGPWTGQLGQIVEENGAVYRLVQFNNGAGAVASAAGGVAHWKTRASQIVTSDHNSAQATVNGVAGGFLGVITNNNYCWVQLGGPQAVTTDTTQAAGTALIAGTTDLTLNATTTNTKGNQLIYGISYGTVSTTSVNIYWVMGNLL